MKDTLFDSEEKRLKALAAFTQLRNDPGWHLVQAIQDANIEYLRDQLENGEGVETKADIDRLRDKIRLMKEFRNIVDNSIKKLTPSLDAVVNIDPYQTVTELEAERKLLTGE